MAANFRGAALELKAAFEARSQHTLSVRAGSSGVLALQIMRGAPVDVFLSADAQRPMMLVESEHAVETKRYAYGALALFSAQPDAPLKLEALGAAAGRVAVANPKTAPYGAAAQTALEALQLWDALLEQKRIAFARNVGGALSAARSGAAQYALVALSAKYSGVQGGWLEVPAQLHPPIAQEAALLKRAQGNPAAQEFWTFLSSDAARKLIERRGYKTNGAQ